MGKNKKRRFAIMRDAHIKAVHDDDIVQLLTSLGYYDKVRSGQCTCYFCNQIISIENLGSIFPLNEEIHFSCNSQECLRKLLELGGDSDEA